ncbi:type 1 glutamine amidotransferase domain-containing protein [Halobacillus amylolyticus]|uniref:Glutamine amidotransferase-like class 1 domain-containing protein 1 n=1 Tax=Halobacillus amylolyticus TaxID=2932259 RepID=A0ABY4H8X7_9BACI|nr:type 1 glutamine amidotransferase domain-containing protein [Halobacillus amylolyticus]UOR11159.1 type 1 glutamine amidotransferase domain-containing protein [Halobacillus amylolyticus]
MGKKILFIATNVDQWEDGQKTGLWLQEFVEPATECKQAGFEVTGASIKGGRIPIDPNSYSNELPRVWDGVMEPIHDTEKLENIDLNDYAGVFFTGGHGTMFDFPDQEVIHSVLQHFVEKDKVIGAVCHGPAAFVGAKDSSGDPFIKGKNITGFSTKEEKEMDFTDKVPFLLEDRLKEEGANFQTAAPFEEHVEVDGKLVTGQNPQSSLATAEAFLKKLT